MKHTGLQKSQLDSMPMKIKRGFSKLFISFLRHFLDSQYYPNFSQLSCFYWYFYSIFLARLFKYWTSCFEAFRIDISRSPKKLCSLVLCVFVFFSVFQEFHRFSILRFYRICCGFPRFALTLRHLYTQNYSSDRFLNTYIYFCGRFRIFFAYFLRTILTVSWII